MPKQRGRRASCVVPAVVFHPFRDWATGRNGREIARLPAPPKNPYGRPIFQGLQYSDTPAMPLVPLSYTDPAAEPGRTHTYRVIAVNTAGLESR